MSRILSIDYGKVRIGLALSDPMGVIASPLGMIRTGKTFEETADLILKEVEGKEIKQIVIGLPLHLSGKESEMSEAVRKLAKIFEKRGITTPELLNYLYLKIFFLTLEGKGLA